MASNPPPPPADRNKAAELPTAKPLPPVGQAPPVERPNSAEVPTAKPLPPADKGPVVEDAPLEQFLERAAPILAVERGINVRSRVRLLAVAREVGLPDGEFEQAVLLLQRAPAQAESPADKATEPFRRYLHAKLEQSTVKTFTPSLEGRAVLVAVNKFQLTPEQARHAIGQVTAERGVKRFSQQDCEDYVNDLIGERLGDAEWLDDESVNRLREAGAEWGLSVAEVDALIVTRAAANRDRRGKEVNSSKLVLTLSVVAGVAVFLIIAVLVIWGNMGSGQASTEEESPEEETDDPSERPRAVQPQKWWDKELASAQSRSRGVVDNYRPVYELLCSDDADQRSKGYEQLVALAQGGREGVEGRTMLKQVVAGSLALEPEDAAAEKLQAALLALVLPSGKKLPVSPDAYDRSIWSVETALAALYHPSTKDRRASELAAALGKALGTTIDRSQPRLEVEARLHAALVTALYRQLAAGAADAPRLAGKLRDRLFELSQEHLKLEEYEQLDVNVLATLLMAGGDAWRDYEPQIAASIGSKDPLVVLKMLEILEGSKNPSLQEYLAENLVLRVRARPKSSAPADVAAAVREALGVVVPVAPTTARDRWQTLKSQAEEALARRPALTTETGKLLDETLLLAHLGTLGCALAQQEPGFALFDQMAKEGPPMLAEKKGDVEEPDSREPARGDTSLPPTASQQRDLVRFVEGLAKYKEHNATQRLSFARGLAGLTERFSEIEPDQAVVIAKYLLGEKPEEEQRRLNDSVEGLCRWKTVRLALADLLADPAAHMKIPLPLAGELLGKAARRDPVATNFEGWTEPARELLLRSVLVDLSTSAGVPSEGPARGIDRASDALLELYRARAKLLNLNAAQYRAAATPAMVLELLASQQAAQLGGGGRSADAEYLARLPHELAVVEYLGTNDIRRTVLAQRVWLRLLSMAVARKRPDQASQARAIVTELTARDLKATHLLLQLRDGEGTTLRMWLLLAPKE